MLHSSPVVLDASAPLGLGAASLSCPHLAQLDASTASHCPAMRMWNLRRPVMDNCPKLKRRELRSQGGPWTLEEVHQHRFADDAWIVVDGKVYDITSHIVDHPGWDTGCGISTILSILAHAGSECTQEFIDIHRPYPIAFKQLRAYYIGDLASK